MAAPSLPLNVLEHPYLELSVPSEWTRLPEQDGLFAVFERADHAMLNVVLATAMTAPSPQALIEQLMAAHADSLARNHPQQMQPQPAQIRTANGLYEATRQYLCQREYGPPWRVTARYATTTMPVSVRGMPLGYPVVQLTVYETPWAGPELERLLGSARIVPLAGKLAHAMERATRWVWISLPGGERMLAYTYDDPMAGPSAKGGIVSNLPTQAELRNAVERPDRTFRDPDAFGAVPLGAEEALRLGLPKDPPWLAVFNGKAPPRRGEATKHLIVFVRRNGELVRGANVKIGDVDGDARELFEVDELTADATGRCDFVQAPARPLAAIAVLDGETSKLVDVPADARSVVLEMQATATLSGEVRKDGRPVAASLSIKSKNGGVHRVERSDAQGRYQITGIVPGRYTIEVLGIHPTTLMTAGTPVFDELELQPGARARRDYTLVGGRTIKVAAAVQNQQHSGHIYLFAGTVAPASSVALRELQDTLSETQWRSASSYSSDGRTMTTDLLDVAPGTYTLCAVPWDRYGVGPKEQPVLCRTIVVGADDVSVEIVLPALRLA